MGVQSTFEGLGPNGVTLGYPDEQEEEQCIALPLKEDAAQSWVSQPPVGRKSAPGLGQAAIHAWAAAVVPSPVPPAPRQATFGEVTEVLLPPRDPRGRMPAHVKVASTNEDDDTVVVAPEAALNSNNEDEDDDTVVVAPEAGPSNNEDEGDDTVIVAPDAALVATRAAALIASTTTPGWSDFDWAAYNEEVARWKESLSTVVDYVGRKPVSGLGQAAVHAWLAAVVPSLVPSARRRVTFGIVTEVLIPPRGGQNHGHSDEDSLRIDPWVAKWEADLRAKARR
ncbi:uncharacterized protein [Drosophila kikkawai]|uniref:Uncharacterized protein n=1 Tax=Drosophila kikkawai TaxID=30033 RepID=A0ABM4GNU5_DROKI